MAKSQVIFYLQRLESLILEETQTFTSLVDQIQSICALLREAVDFLQQSSSPESDAPFSAWLNNLIVIITEMDDHVDEFIIQIDKHSGSDMLALTQCFRTEMQKIESRLAETINTRTQLKISTTIEGNIKQFHGQEEGPTSSASSSFSFSINYRNLPYYLQSCLMYCYIFPEESWIGKGKLIRLLVAEGLIQEKPGQVLEEVAEENINQLLNLGMLEVIDEHPGNGTKLTLSSPYRLLLRENFTSVQSNSDVNIPRTARRVLASDLTELGQYLNNLRPRSLFLSGNQEHFEGSWLDLTWAKFLRVLDLQDTKIKGLPDEVGDLVHLAYLGLKATNINELPARLGKLRALQTLDIRWCGHLSELSPEILNLTRVRHLKMFKNMNVSGMKLPEGIGRLISLLTLTGIHGGDGIAGELDKLTQLRSLGVMDVTEENASELYVSISKMQGLICLSLQAKHAFRKENILPLESFSPPPVLRKLRLEGSLEKIPSWFGLLENLTKLRLGFSHLSENPTLVLQILPSLKNLTLWHAYDARQLGKEFCKAGGFPKLEVFSIASHVLEEWTELEEGALPSLQYLHLHNCLSLRMLPEGLQFVTTLKQLDLLPLLDEHAERLKPDGGEENYKISHIPMTSFITMSALNSIVGSPTCHQTQETSEE